MLPEFQLQTVWTSYWSQMELRVDLQEMDIFN